MWRVERGQLITVSSSRDLGSPNTACSERPALPALPSPPDTRARTSLLAPPSHLPFQLSPAKPTHGHGGLRAPDKTYVLQRQRPQPSALAQGTPSPPRRHRTALQRGDGESTSITGQTRQPTTRTRLKVSRRLRKVCSSPLVPEHN